MVVNLLFLLPFFVERVNGVRRNFTYEERESKLRKSRIIPELIKKMPEHPLQIKYVKNCVVNYGNLLQAPKLEYEPFRFRWPCGLQTYYTLIMIDPDVPSKKNPKKREQLLWLVVNIKAIFVMAAQHIAKYMKPDPGKDTGPHRIVFILFEQPNGVTKFNETDYNDPDDLDCRYHFSTEQFAKKYNLGDPHAVNFFTTRWKYVPTTAEPWGTPAPGYHNEILWDGDEIITDNLTPPY